jgi:Domain of unknown function (DUF5655)
VTRWTCPACDREFARTRQSHVCVPGGSVDDTFAGRPEGQRAAYDALVECLRELGPVHEDAVAVGVFLKRERKLAVVRPMVRSLHLMFILGRRVEDPRITRTLPVAADTTMHVVKLTGPGDVDERVREWMAEAYDLAGDSP